MKSFFSSVSQKFIISLSGLFLLIFITMHLCLNLTALVSKEWYDYVCEFMDTNVLVKFMVPVLALGFIIHILFASAFEFQNWAARPRALKYAVSTHTKGVSWPSKNMFVLGVLILAFLALHFCHFWAKMQLQGFLGNEEDNAYELVVALFSKWYYCVIYAVWVIALFFHVEHGFWSAFQSLGLSNANWLPRLKCLAKIFAVLILLGYLALPAAVVSGCMGGCCHSGCNAVGCEAVECVDVCGDAEESEEAGVVEIEEVEVEVQAEQPNE